MLKSYFNGVEVFNIFIFLKSGQNVLVSGSLVSDKGEQRAKGNKSGRFIRVLLFEEVAQLPTG